MTKEDLEVPEWMKDNSFEIGFEDPNAIVPDCAVSTNEYVDYDSIQRWDVTAERNGVIGVMDNQINRKGNIVINRKGVATVPSVVDGIRQIIRPEVKENINNFVLLIKGKMITMGTCEQVTANILHAVHSDQIVSDEDIVVLEQIELSKFFEIPTVKVLLDKVKQKV